MAELNKTSLEELKQLLETIKAKKNEFVETVFNSASR